MLAAPPERLEVERRRSVLDEMRYAAGGGMLEDVLKVLTEGERRECCGLGGGWARWCELGACMGKTFDDVVLVREWP